jgi:hypothetical protein
LAVGSWSDIEVPFSLDEKIAVALERKPHFSTSIVIMPRTRASKSDTRTPLEKLQIIDSKAELFIFFNYYDGFATDGTLGFAIGDRVPAGSMKHYVGVIPDAFTKNQFRNKAKKLAQLAKAFHEKEEVPPQNLRPLFAMDEISLLRESNRDTRTTAEKFAEIEKSTELFVFFKYYDGYKTDGEIGFSPRSGPPGSINHLRSYQRLALLLTESQFRDIGKKLAIIATECVDNDYTPPENVRPAAPGRPVPWGMMEVAFQTF